MQNNITFIIFTYNEEKRIERVIRNFRHYGTVLLADNKSTDRTAEIARSYGCEVFIREQNYEFVENQHLADLLYKEVKTDWIYWGFADEMLEKGTLEEIHKIIAADKHDIISIDRKNYYYGKFCYNLYHARTWKIFKKHAIDFSDNVIHGTGKPTVKEDRIYKLPDKYFVHHFISNTAVSYLRVINTYTDTELKFKYTAKTSVFYLVYLVVKGLVKNYFIDKGYKAGYAGLALAELFLFYALVKIMKHYEQSNNLTTPGIEATNDVHRDKILEGILK